MPPLSDLECGFCRSLAGRIGNRAADSLAVARMAYYTVGISAHAAPSSRELHGKHFLRKHGVNAYFGQVPRE